jgi:hypothetical protein
MLNLESQMSKVSHKHERLNDLNNFLCFFDNLEFEV